MNVFATVDPTPQENVAHFQAMSYYMICGFFYMLGSLSFVVGTAFLIADAAAQK